MFPSFDHAVSYYKAEADRKGLPSTLRAEHVSMLTGYKRKTIYDAFGSGKLIKSGDNPTTHVENVVRFLHDKGDIAIRA